MNSIASINNYISSTKKSITTLINKLNFSANGNPIYNINNNENIFDIRRSNPYYLSKVAHEINESFSTICASPKRASLFKSSYVFPDPLDNTISKNDKKNIILYNKNPDNFKVDLDVNPNGIGINANSDCMKIFSEFLCQRSVLTYERKRATYEKVLYLTGNYGEGKTFFINYLLSVFNDEIFVKNKVITIKLDLSSMFDVGIDDIKLKIAYKAIRILKKHYFLKKIICPKLFNEYLEDISCFTMEHKKEIYTFFSNEQYDLDINHKQINDLYNTLLHYLTQVIQEKYSFVIIIDGLDNYYRDIKSEKIFDKRIKYLTRYFANAGNYRICYLVVMRNESFSYLQNLKGGAAGTNNFINIKLYPVKPCSIVNFKFKLLVSYIDNGCPDGTLCVSSIKFNKEQNTAANQFYDYIYEFHSFINEFIMFSFKHSTICKKQDNKSFSFVLRHLFNKNNRDIVEAYSVIARDVLITLEFDAIASVGSANYTNIVNYIRKIVQSKYDVEKFARRKFYVAHEALMLNKFVYSIPRYEYGYRKRNKKRIGPCKTGNYYNASLIPNIFYVMDPLEFFKENRFIISNEMKNYNNHFLIKLRILQYFHYKTNNGIPERFCDAEKVLRNCFGYLKPWVMYESRMLYAENCLEKPNNNVPEKPINNHRMRLSYLGDYILNNLLYHYSYYQNVVDYFNTDSAVCNNFFSPPISITSIDDLKRNYNHNQMNHLVSQKIKRVISFIALLETFEELEMKYFLDKTGKKYFSFDDYATSHDLCIVKDIKQSVSMSIHRITNKNKKYFDTFFIDNYKTKNTSEQSHTH